MFYPLGLYGITVSDCEPMSQTLPFYLPYCTMSRCFQPDDALMSELPVCFPEHTQMYHHQHLQENWLETEGFDYAPNLGSEPDHTGDNLSRGVNELILDKQWGYSTPATSPKCMKQELQADTTAHGFSSQYHDAAAASQGFHPTAPSTAARFFSTSVQHLEPTTLNPLDISGWPLPNDALSTSAHAQASFPAAAHGIAPHEIPCGPFGLGQLNAGSGQSQIGLDLPMHHENYLMQETSASAGSLQPEPSFCRDWTKRVNLPPYERTEKDLNLLRWKKEGLSYKEIKIRGNYMEAESTLRGRYRNLIKAKDKRVRKPTWRAKDVSFRAAVIANPRR